MSAKKSEKWFLVQWNDGHNRSVVSSRCVVNPPSEAQVGAVVTIVSGSSGDLHLATIIGSSRDRQLLEQQISPAKLYNDPGAGPSVTNNEPLDFSASGSSWAPSDEGSSTSEEEEVENKRIKLERYSRSYSRNSSKILKPCHRANAINAIINRRRKLEESKKKQEKNNNKKIPNKINNKKSQPDSTKKNIVQENKGSELNQDTVTVNVRDLLGMKQCFHELFKIIKEMKISLKKDISSDDADVLPDVKLENEQTIGAEEEIESQSMETDRSQGEESNRSDDNVLITNKFDKVTTNTPRVLNIQNKQAIDHQDEWIPIGSGKTLIHKDQFRKVNFKSYTIATRTLLLALFPRRILATHSLTGKRSPAFQDKPAKMCLDPKIVSDVIIEITDRFGVKENLVRSIITTKCADECKMFRTRMKRKTMPTKNQENLPPELAETDDPANQTC